MDNKNFDIGNNHLEKLDNLTDKQIHELYNDIVEGGLRYEELIAYCYSIGNGCAACYNCSTCPTYYVGTCK